MPASGVALLIALAMTPGYAYLYLTADLRRPEKRSAFAETLETLVVGLGTSGLSVTALVLLLPQSAKQILRTLATPAANLTAEQLRGAASSGVTIAATSFILAWLFSRAARWLARRRFSPSVSHATLGLDKAGHARVVTVGLIDGSTVDGLLHAYSMADDDAARTIALKAPMRRQVDDKVIDLGVDFLIVPGGQIRHVMLQHVLDPGAIKGGRRRRNVLRQ